MPAFNHAAYNAVAVSSTTVYYSDPTNLRNCSQAAYQLLWTGTPTGTFVVQVSNVPKPALGTDTDWKELVLAVAITQPAGSATGDYIDLTPLPFLWVRLKYTNGSGSGAITAYAQGKSA